MTNSDPAREIEAILKRGIGLDARSIGASMVALAVQNRMKKRGIRFGKEYAALIAGSEVEFQALVEELVVPETWFFRDREAFAVLTDWVVNEWLPAHPYESLRLLSSPCSSGEEPYSIVMALLEAGVAPDRFSVEAVDISAVSLAKARRAVYSRNSFRGQGLEFRDKYFQKTSEGWRLGEEVARQVHFRQINVLDPGFMRKDGEVDAIFCRNLLIYFDESSRARMMEKLGRMLSPTGLLFLGHAEGGLAREFGFEAVAVPMSFAFRKAAHKAAEPSRSRRPQPAAAPRPPRPVLAVDIPKIPVLAVPKPPAPVRTKPAPAAELPESPEAMLDRVQQMADAGQLEKARTACLQLLEKHGASSRAYFLLGLIADAAGAVEEAREDYKKALYMESDHYEALIQLSLLEQKQGDSKAARQLEERARRVRTKKESKTGPTR